MSRIAGALSCAAAFITLAGCQPRSVDRPAPSLAQVPEYFPGVDVMRTPVGGVLVRIRGGMAGSGHPLYVIDGTPLEVDPKRGVDWLAPHEIARIEVLKGPAQTAVYGPRGVDGVILITTKR